MSVTVLLIREKLTNTIYRTCFATALFATFRGRKTILNVQANAKECQGKWQRAPHQQLIFKEHLSDICSRSGNPYSLDIRMQKSLLNYSANLEGEKKMVMPNRGQTGGMVHRGIYLRSGAL